MDWLQLQLFKLPIEWQIGVIIVLMATVFSVVVTTIMTTVYLILKGIYLGVRSLARRIFKKS